MINLNVLTRPFLVSEVKQRKNEAGKTFDYVEAHSVIARLNEAFQGAWSFRILQYQTVEDEVIVLGELEADGLVKQQFGSAKLERTEPERLSVGDTFKAAASDALKKCATEFGVALELYAGAVYAMPENGAETRVAEAPAPNPATKKQIAFLEKIVQRPDLPEEDRKRVQTALGGALTKTEASELITDLTRTRAA